MKREPRLQFSDADLVEPKLEKPIKRVKKAEAKADKAQAKIPKKTVVKKERGFDPATGKVKTQLRFEEVDKKATLQADPCRAGCPRQPCSLSGSPGGAAERG